MNKHFIPVPCQLQGDRPAEIDLFLRATDHLAALSEQDLRQWAATRHDVTTYRS